VPEEQSEDVKQHNREMDDRHGRSQNQVDDDGKDNVGKGFWGGTYNPSSSGKSKLMFAPRSRRQGQESIGREVIDLRVEMLRHTEVTTALKWCHERDWESSNLQSRSLPIAKASTTL